MQLITCSSVDFQIKSTSDSSLSRPQQRIDATIVNMTGNLFKAKEVMITPPTTTSRPIPTCPYKQEVHRSIHITGFQIKTKNNIPDSDLLWPAGVTKLHMLSHYEGTTFQIKVPPVAHSLASRSLQSTSCQSGSATPPPGRGDR